MPVPFEMSKEEADRLFVEIFGELSPSGGLTGKAEIVEEYTPEDLRKLLGDEPWTPA